MTVDYINHLIQTYFWFNLVAGIISLPILFGIIVTFSDSTPKNNAAINEAMRRHWVILLLLISTVSIGQQRKGYAWKQAATITASFISGAADGYAEVLQHNRHAFFYRHPNANRQFWDASISWRNKYKNGNQDEGAAFPLSTSVLVGTTDGYHAARSVRNIMATVSTGFALSLYEKPKFKHIILQAALNTSAYLIGKGIVHKRYDVF